LWTKGNKTLVNVVKFVKFHFFTINSQGHTFSEGSIFKNEKKNIILPVLINTKQLYIISHNIDTSVNSMRDHALMAYTQIDEYMCTQHDQYSETSPVMISVMAHCRHKWVMFWSPGTVFSF